MGSSGNISGFCAPTFAPVRQAFARNFQELGEVGACFALFQQGEMVVDLWGGFLDPDRTRPWQENTITNTQSVVKGIYPLTAFLLIEAGELELNRPVVHYWPQFGQAGKQNISVAQLLSHTAGLVFPDHAPKDPFVSWQEMVEALEKQAPEWEPGSRGAYHTSTYGFLVGELVSRVAGQWVGEFFADQIAGPFDLDFHLRTNDLLWQRVAPLIFKPGTFTLETMPQGPIRRAWHFLPEPEKMWNNKEFFNRKTICGYGNARAMARLFGILATGGQFRGKSLLGPGSLELLTRSQWAHHCPILQSHVNMGMGMFLEDPDFLYMGSTGRNFAAFGLGGFAAIGDPLNGLGMAYSANNIWTETLESPRLRHLIEAVYACI